MTETTQPALPRWAQFWDDVLTAREVRRKSAIDAVRRFVELNPLISDRSRRKAVIEARLQLAEELVSARIEFRRAVVRSAAQVAANG